MTGHGEDELGLRRASFFSTGNGLAGHRTNYSRDRQTLTENA
jgi:hypothetical protein